MHLTAMNNGTAFFHKYGPFGVVVEIGSKEVCGGTLRQAAEGFYTSYIGVDMEDGESVDVVVDDPYNLPMTTDSADAVVSSSCFEHDRFFWLSFLEMARIVKPGGFIYINAPSNGVYHRFPVDCWRFYPDSGQALAEWAQRNGIQMELIETFIGEEDGGGWKDCVSVWKKL